ncbi:MAG: tyrosine-type recombinase/integrase [Dokdonella sp.]
MLTDRKLRSLKPREKLYRIADSDGLCIEVMPSGTMLWRYRYRSAGAARMIAIGDGFPRTSLVDARALRDQQRALLRSGVDPSAKRKQLKALAGLAGDNTFLAVADELLDRQRAKLAAITATKAEWLISLVPTLHTRPIGELTPPEVLAALRKIEATGTIETAHRIKQRIGQVFRYAIATGRAERDVSADLRGALAPVVSTSHAAVTDPAAVGGLLRAIYTYIGQPTTAAALKLAPLLFARPGNLRAMEWAELELDAGEWRIAAGKMKMRQAHVVPLSTQAVAILRDLHELTGEGTYCFPSIRTPERAMSENTINAALRRLGYDKASMTGHGFRAMASTRLNELGWPPDVIERQLAHAERNKVRKAYNRAQYLAERRKMMQAWADYLDGLRAGAVIVPIKRAR